MSTVQPPADTSAASSPWAAFGLNDDGSPLVKPVDPKPADAPAGVTPEAFAAMSTKLEAAEKRIASIDGLEKKAAVVDRLIKAISGDSDASVADKGYRDVMKDLEDVARSTNPGFYKALMALKNNPDLIDQMGGSMDTLHKERVSGLNTQAHTRVIEAAKLAFGKNIPSAELTKMAYPYEAAITQMINANPELQKQFLSGNVTVVDDLFKEMVKPFVSQRLAEKQRRMAPSAAPKAPPRGAAEPGATGGANEPTKLNLRDPKQRAAFHKEAAGRFFSRARGDEE